MSSSTETIALVAIKRSVLRSCINFEYSNDTRFVNYACAGESLVNVIDCVIRAAQRSSVLHEAEGVNIRDAELTLSALSLKNFSSDPDECFTTTLKEDATTQTQWSGLYFEWPSCDEEVPPQEALSEPGCSRTTAGTSTDSVRMLMRVASMPSRHQQSSELFSNGAGQIEDINENPDEPDSEEHFHL